MSTSIRWCWTASSAKLGQGKLTLHPAPPSSDEDVAQVLVTVRARAGQLLGRRHLEPADDTATADPLAEVSPVLAGLVGASVQGRVALGPRAGARVRRLGDQPDLKRSTLRIPYRMSKGKKRLMPGD